MAKVLQVISGLEIGGVPNHLLALVNGLSEDEFDITVAYLKGSGELESEFRKAGSQIERIGIRTDADPFGLFRLYRLMSKGNFDLVHCHLFHGDVYGTTAAALAGVPRIISSKHNDPPFWRGQPYKAIHNATLSKVDKVISISDRVQEHLIEVSGIEKGKVRTIHYGIDPTPFDEVEGPEVRAVRREFSAENRPLIGTVARLTEQKNLENLLYALERIADDFPKVRLAIVGEGEEETKLRTLSRELGLEEHVVFAGFRKDIPALMHAFDVFALPSLWEGFGMVFLEAMAARTPVVASEVSAIPEVVKGGRTGFLKKPEDSEGFARSIIKLIEDPELAKEMGERGRKRLEENFTEERMVRETVRIYDELLV